MAVCSETHAILRCDQVEAVTGLGRSSIYAMAKAGDFPSPIRLAKRASGWLQSEVNDFIQSRINESRGIKKGGV